VSSAEPTNPDRTADLGVRFAAITPGYHLNKWHWNTMALDGSVPHEELLELMITPTSWSWRD
jgi:predicted DNA-binding protein (MmcQ/YjbR family)